MGLQRGVLAEYIQSRFSIGAPFRGQGLRHVVREALLPLHESRFNPQGFITEEAAAPSFMSEKVLAGVLAMALPVSGRAHV